MVKNYLAKYSIKGKGKFLSFSILLAFLIMLLLLVLYFQAGREQTTITSPLSGGFSMQQQEVLDRIVRIDSLSDADDLLAMETELHHLIATEADWITLPFLSGDLVWIYDQIGDFYQRLSDLEHAKKYNERAYVLLDSISDLSLKSAVLINKSNIESDLGNFESAIRILFEGMQLYGEDTTAVDFVDFYNNLGSAYSGIENYDLAIHYFEKLIRLAENLDLEHEYGYYYGNLGHTYLLLGDLGKSIRYLEQAKEYFAKFGQLEEELLLNTILASNYTKIGRLVEAEALLKDNLGQLEQRQLWMPYVETTISLFDYYIAIGNPAAALKVIDSGMEKIHYSQTDRLTMKIYDRLIAYYEGNKNYPQAFYYLNERNQLADSISNATKGDLMRELTVRYETDRKNARISQLTTLNEKERNRNRVFGLSILLLVSIMILIGLLLRRIAIQNRALADANYTKDRLFSVIAHDLRSPMSALQGVSSLLRHYLEQKDEEKLLELSYKTDFTLNNINDLLDNLLNWAVANHQEIKVEPDVISIQELLTDTIRLYSSNIESRKIQFEQKVEEAVVFGDPNMISSVFRNILSNAIKHTPKNGFITLKGQVTGEYYQVSLQDSGPGIPEEVLRNLFRNKDKLLRSEEKDSFGLGLRLALFFVRKNGGDLKITNSEAGALAVVLLPLNKSIEI